MKFDWDPKEQSNKRHPVNIRYPVQHIGEVRSCKNRKNQLHICVDVLTMTHMNKHSFSNPWPWTLE